MVEVLRSGLEMEMDFGEVKIRRRVLWSLQEQNSCFSPASCVLYVWFSDRASFASPLPAELSVSALDPRLFRNLLGTKEIGRR
jgi:hypothetical protein